MILSNSHRLCCVNWRQGSAGEVSSTKAKHIIQIRWLHTGSTSLGKGGKSIQNTHLLLIKRKIEELSILVDTCSCRTFWDNSNPTLQCPTMKNMRRCAADGC